MREFSTQAIVLDKESYGEVDARVFLYSPEYGKITAKAKSIKKPLSKLNSHLEPFNLVNARIIDRGPQIVDALAIERLTPSWELAKFLNFIKEITFEGQADYQFWTMIKNSIVSGKIDYRKFLAAQGFDPQFALCQNCQKPNPNNFLYKDMIFYCNSCTVNDKCLNGFLELS